MVDINTILKDKNRRNMKKDLKTDLTLRIAWILSNSKREFQDNLGNIHQYDEAHYQKSEFNIPPFYLGDREILEKAKQIIENHDNPYLNLATDFDELIFSKQLHDLDPNIEKDVLKKFNFKNLINSHYALDRKLKLVDILAEKKEKYEQFMSETGFDKAIFRELINNGFQVTEEKFLEKIHEKIGFDSIMSSIGYTPAHDQSIDDILSGEKEGMYLSSTSQDVEIGSKIRIITDEETTVEGKVSCKCEKKDKIAIKYKCYTISEIYGFFTSDEIIDKVKESMGKPYSKKRVNNKQIIKHLIEKGKSAISVNEKCFDNYNLPHDVSEAIMRSDIDSIFTYYKEKLIEEEVKRINEIETDIQKYSAYLQNTNNLD